MTEESLSVGFVAARRPVELAFRRANLESRTWLNDHYLRVRVAGSDLRGFGEGNGVDDHVRLFFVGEPDGTVEEMRAAPSREFTPLAWGEDWIDFEFVSHGEQGVAGVWAATAPIGSPLGIGGPRGSLHFDGEPDAWLLAGDESAVAQIKRFAAAIPPETPAYVIVEVENAAHEQPIAEHLPIEFVHRKGAPAGSALAAALATLGADDRPEGSVFGFVAAESAIVPAGRALLLDRWGLPPEQTLIKGYWKAPGRDLGIQAAL